MGDSVTSKVVGQKAKNVNIKDKIVERGVVGTVKKYKGWKEAGEILPIAFSKPKVKFNRDDIHEWEFVDFKTLVGRTVTFDLINGKEVKNVRLVVPLLIQFKTPQRRTCKDSERIFYFPAWAEPKKLKKPKEYTDRVTCESFAACS